MERSSSMSKRFESRASRVAGRVLALLSLSLAGASAQEAPASPVSLEALREAVLANEAKAALIRMEYRVSYEESGGPPPSPEQIEAGLATHGHSVYAQDGARLHHTRSDYADAKWLRGGINVVDGEVHKQSILPDLMWGRIDRIETFNWASVCPAGLGFRPFNNKYRLSELLVPAHASVQEDCVTFEGRPAAVVKAGYPGENFYALIWMDLERGMPLHIEYRYPNKEGGGYHRGWMVEGIKLHRLPNGGWIPVQGIGRQHIKRPEFELHNVLHVVVDVNSISIDKKDIPDSLFDIQFPPGAKVENGIVGPAVAYPPRLYFGEVGGDGSDRVKSFLYLARYPQTRVTGVASDSPYVACRLVEEKPGVARFEAALTSLPASGPFQGVITLTTIDPKSREVTIPFSGVVTSAG